MGAIEPITYTLKTGETLLVRQARLEDADQLVDMMNAIVQEDIYTLVGPGERVLTAERERERIAEHAVQPGYLYLVADVAGQIVGRLDFSNGQWRKIEHAGMLALYIRQGWRERGVGTLLLQRLLGWAAEHPLIEKVTLAVFSNNPRAIAVYQKCGFAEEGRCARDMKLASGEYIDSVLMYRFVK
jgi:RimJ/RimL family protein N-acetyltransferase